MAGSTQMMVEWVAKRSITQLQRHWLKKRKKRKEKEAGLTQNSQSVIDGNDEDVAIRGEDRSIVSRSRIE
jgi:hypothetical protein